MPWRCPACNTEIRHPEAQLLPPPRQYYRCHVCRIELFVDPVTQKMVLAPLGDDEKEKNVR
jgi:hypothetical protein